MTSLGTTEPPMFSVPLGIPRLGLGTEENLLSLNISSLDSIIELIETDSWEATSSAPSVVATHATRVEDQEDGFIEVKGKKNKGNKVNSKSYPIVLNNLDKEEICEVSKPMSDMDTGHVESSSIFESVISEPYKEANVSSTSDLFHLLRMRIFPSRILYFVSL
ncbi:hypothetical protein Tco_1520676, partial [Tanacetum coccineum]